MTSADFAAGALIYGALAAGRLTVDHAALLSGYADFADEDTTEAYLSHFVYGSEYRRYHAAHGGSDAGYTGPCWCRWLVLDIDRAGDLQAALVATRQLVSFVSERYAVDPVVYFSGGKGFHVLIELTHDPAPCVGFNEAAKRFSLTLANRAGVQIDPTIYNVTRPIRLPNTRHPGTGLHKRRIDPDDLFSWDIDAILRHAECPAGDGLPSPGVVSPQLVTDWTEAAAGAAATATSRAADRAEKYSRPDTRLPKRFLELFRFGVPEGERAVTLFQAAAYLTEQGAPPSFCSLFLTETATDTGMTPGEVAKQIRDGIAYATRKPIVSATVTASVTDDQRERESIAHESDPLPPGAMDFGFGTSWEPESACPEWPVWGVIRGMDRERGEGGAS